MNYIIYCYFIGYLIISSKYKVTFNGRSRRMHIKIGILIIPWILLLYYTSVNTADADAYSWMFSGSKVYRDAFDRSRNLLLYTADAIRAFHGSYSLFRAFFGVFYVIPIIMTVKGKYSKYLNESFYLLLVLIYPFFISVATLAFTISSGLVTISLYAYISSEKQHLDLLCSAFLIIVAAGFHETAWIYLALFLGLHIFEHMKNRKTLIPLFIFIDVVAMSVIRSGVGVALLEKYLGSAVGVFLGEWTTRGYGWVLSFAIQLIYFFLLKNKGKQIDGMEETEVRNYYNTIVNLNYIMILFLPFYMIHVVFFRLFRGVLLLQLPCYAFRSERRFRMNIWDASLLAMQVFLMVYDSGLIIMNTAF